MTSIGKNTIAGELLRGFVERIENINAEIKQLGAYKALVMAEAKASNLVPAAVTYIVKKRLWTLGIKDHAVRSMPWPLPMAADIAAEKPTQAGADNIVSIAGART